MEKMKKYFVRVLVLFFMFGALGTVVSPQQAYALTTEELKERYQPGAPQWDEDIGEAVWTAKYSTVKFELKLYRNGDLVKNSISASTSPKSLVAYMTKPGYYSYKIRGIFNGSKKTDWVESEELYVSDALAARYQQMANGSGTTAETGSQGNIWVADGTRWKFLDSNGSYASNIWVLTNGQWYYIGSDGYMVVAQWVQSNGQWYYVGADGALYVSRYTPDGYYVNENGVWVQ